MVGKNKHLRIKSVLGSKRLFVAILSVFATYSVAIAVTSDFPLPYDENYHFTLVQHYSQQLSPFIASQPAELSATGDATRMGSYLMHYLLSFPLRLTAYFTTDVNLQVIILRLINIAFVCGALVLFRKFITQLIKSGMAANGLTALFCMLPVTAFLSAHINYDNLLLLCFAGLLVMAQAVIVSVKRSQPLSFALLSVFVAVTLLATLVKFTFLPIAATFLFFMGVLVITSGVWRTISIPTSYKSKAALVASFIICCGAIGLVAERYGGNMVAYKTPQPDCSQVQPLNVCMQYGPWARNYNLELAAASDTGFEARSFQGYVARVWAPLMIRGLGGVDTKGAVPGVPHLVLLALLVGAIALGLGMVGAAIMYRKNVLVLMVVTGVILYCGALLQRNYSEYLAFHEIVAVQGRYIVPLVIPVVAFGVIGLKLYIRQAGIVRKAIAREIVMMRQLQPREAYERSVNYWSSRTWQRSTDN